MIQPFYFGCNFQHRCKPIYELLIPLFTNADRDHDKLHSLFRLAMGTIIEIRFWEIVCIQPANLPLVFHPSLRRFGAEGTVPEWSVQSDEGTDSDSP
jgi:hypothetical protein